MDAENRLFLDVMSSLRLFPGSSANMKDFLVLSLFVHLII